jgi:transcriptional regulator with XRE-family HTH domain
VNAARETDAVGRLAERLRAMRAELGMSLKELESRTHTSDSSLSRYLSGKAAAPWPVVVALCELADRDPETLRPVWEQARILQPPTAGAADPAANGTSTAAPEQQAPISETPRRPRPRILPRTRDIIVLLIGLGLGLGGPPAARSAGHQIREATHHKPPPSPLIHENPASGPAGRFDYVTDPYVRTKTQPGPFRMTLRDSPTGWLCVKLVDARTHRTIGRVECLNNGDTKTLVGYMPAVTHFQVDGMSGAAGQYHGSMYY